MKELRINRLVSILRQFYIAVTSGNIQKRLGYSRNSILLIIHADDLGLSGSENEASIEAMKNGLVNSGSVMVPCPKYHQIVEYSKRNPEADLGIHLTLTSEWSIYKWGPVLPPSEVVSIVGLNGTLLESKEQIAKNAVTGEVEKEFRAQINKALESGIDLTHIDTHMFTAFSNNEILKTYINLGEEFKLPVLISNELTRLNIKTKNLIYVNRLYYARPENYINGLNSYYTRVLNSMKPGLNCILLHIAFKNKEMQDITLDQLNYGSDWRQADFDFFTSNECREIIKNRNIQLVTWREIRDKLVRSV